LPGCPGARRAAIALTIINMYWQYTPITTPASCC